MGWPAGHPERGDYRGVEEAAKVMERVAAWLEVVAETVGATAGRVSVSWEGGPGEKFATTSGHTAAIVGANATEARRAATILRGVAETMNGSVFPQARAAQARLKDAEDDLVAAQDNAMGAGDLGVVSWIDQHRIGKAAEEVAAMTRRLELIGEQRDDEATSAARDLAAIEFQPIPYLAAGDGTLMVGTGILGGFGRGFGAELTVPVPAWWATTDLSTLTPAQIRAQWDLLTDAQRHALIASDPLLYGNLDGIPLGWRAKANEINLRNEIARLEAEIDRLEDSKVPADHLSDAVLGFMGGSAIQKKIDEARKKIDAYRETLRPEKYDRKKPKTWRTIDYGPDGRYAPYDPADGWPKGSQVILFDPANKRIGTYHGTFTPDGDIPPEYENVVTLTPGTGTQPWKWDDPDMRGSQLYVDANRKGGSTAVIVYSDGPQPQEADAITPGYAQDMGARLVRFADANIPAGSTYTAMGHSYGATTVAQAEVAGLRADRVLYVAPAGYGQAPDGHMVRGLADFPHTGDKPHYVMISRTDPVVGLIQGDRDFGIHGKSPTYDPDVTRLETGWLNTKRPEQGYLDDHFIDSHSTPFNYETTAHDNMVEVIIGGTAEGWEPDVFEEDEAGGLTYRDKEDWPDVGVR